MTLLTISRMAEDASVSRDHIRRAIARGELWAYDLGTGGRHTWRVAQEDFDAYLAERRLVNDARSRRRQPVLPERPKDMALRRDHGGRSSVPHRQDEGRGQGTPADDAPGGRGRTPGGPVTDGRGLPPRVAGGGR